MPKKSYPAKKKQQSNKRKLLYFFLLLLSLPVIVFQVQQLQDTRQRADSSDGLKVYTLPDGRTSYLYEEPKEIFRQRESTVRTAAAVVPCVGNGTSGPRIQVVYAYPQGEANRIAEVGGQIKEMVAGASEIVDLSAQKTGGRRQIRYVTNPDCSINIHTIALPSSKLQDTTAVAWALYNQKKINKYRNAVVFVDQTMDQGGFCGKGNIMRDTRPGWDNKSNEGTLTAQIGRDCWYYDTVAHEIMHTLGAVQPDTPNSSGISHCTDDYDVMCSPDGSARPIRVVCPDRAVSELFLDCNNDDYFSLNPSGYLATHWNAAYSVFLDDPLRNPVIRKSGGATRVKQNKRFVLSGFQPGEAVMLRWNDSKNAKAVRANAAGNWSGNLRMPNKPGRTKLVARGSKGSFGEITFSVQKELKKKKKNKR